MIRMHPVLASVLVIEFVAFVFWRVRIDYAIRGLLSEHTGVRRCPEAGMIVGT